jgi:hypothetical protein
LEKFIRKSELDFQFGLKSAFAENLAIQAPALARIVTESADAALMADAGIGAP